MKVEDVIAVAVVVFWAVFVGRFLYDQAVMVGGRIAPKRPTVFEVIFSLSFSLLWGIPSTIFIAIWGGIFWW